VAAPAPAAGNQTPSRDAPERLATAVLAARPPIEGERRQATVLVVDISGYSAMCVRLDAEIVQNLLGRFYDVTDRIIANYGGHIIDHAGDATMAVFGAPVAHDNDGERAARAAFDMHAQSAAIADTCDGPLRLHVGIASGEVVAATISAGAQPKYAVTGEAVNLAARLNAFAEAGQTLITDAAYRSVSHLLDAQALGAIALKGFDQPVLLWNVDGLRYTTRERRPFVGRQTELRKLMSVLDAVQETGNGLALFVRGEAGIGKSHLVDEVRSRAVSRGFACHRGDVLDFGVRKGQDAIAAIVKDMLEAPAPGDQVSLRTAVNRGLTSGLVAPDQEVLINDLLELEQTPEQRAVFDAMDYATRARRIHELITGMLQRCAVHQPRLLIVEDIHWASPDLLQYLALLTRAASEMRVVLLMTSRIEGDPLDKHWRASTQGTPFMTVDVGPLRPEEARMLAGRLMEAYNPIALNCIERAEGNPLFLEQLLRNAVESEVERLPATIQSLILARMDRLLPRDKERDSECLLWPICDVSLACQGARQDEDGHWREVLLVP
jgi:class 3 adenylate cyclase